MNTNPNDHKPIDWRKRLINSRFFTISCVLHLMIVVLLGGTVLFNKFVEPDEFTAAGEDRFVQDTEPQQPPAPAVPVDITPNFTVNTNQQQSINFDTIIANTPTEAAFKMDQMFAPSKTQDSRIGNALSDLTPPPAFPGQSSDPKQRQDISDFTAPWRISTPGTTIKTSEFKFTAYLAKYSGGDWASTVRLEKGQIAGGSLPNLLYVMQKFSNGKIKAQHQAEPLDLSSDVIFLERAPFIFFTGHRDFQLTDKEVENLQKYIRLGGCIWGDSSLPGQRSRFDIAFRREMRRVVGQGEDFMRLPDNHPLFTKNLYYPEIRSTPSGLNHYKEPVYAMMHLGQIAVLYTANDYGDMWQIGLNDQWKFETARTESGAYVAMNPAIWDRRDSYFRNIDEAAVKATYQFGTNIVIHLLTRWEDMTRNVPKSL